MAAPTGLLFTESFDHFNTVPEMQGKWTSLGTGGAFVPGRSGAGQAYEVSSTSSPALCLGYEYLTLAVGFGIKTNSFGSAWVTVTNVGTNGFELAGYGDGRLRVDFPFTAADSGPLPGFVFALNTWYYCELLITFNWTGTQMQGIYTVLINGSIIATGTIQFPWGAQIRIADVSFGGPGGGGRAQYDDIYITDGEALGDYNWICIFPNAAGDSSQWTPHPTQANYLNVQEHNPDEFATYNQGDGVGDQDLYNMDNVGNVSIIGIQALNRHTKIAAGVTSFKSSIKTNATLIQEGEIQPSFGSWLYQRQPYRKNPVTGLDWTTADINAIQRGALRIS